ncbi:MAG: Lsm family RNA-binding protein [Candidatus Nezhaarchaeales archaeon]
MSATMYATRRLVSELLAFLDKMVLVKTSTDRMYEGKFIAFDQQSFGICLADAKDKDGVLFSRVFINGHQVSEILLKEAPFDLRGLAAALEKVFPKMVTLHEEAGVITVMDRVRVTEKGVVEGSGPVADRVKKVYEEFIGKGRKE